MKLISYPARNEWTALLQRPALNSYALVEKVQAVMNEVKGQGDAAIKKFTLEFDGVGISESAVSPDEITEAAALVPAELQAAIRQAAANITRFHEKQVAETEIIETMPGVQCWRKSVGIEKVGLYIPGGTAPLFSTILMLGIPAKIAGCKEVILCSPPDKSGKLHPAILYAAQVTGITKIFKIGGVQAIAAMAYGTETVPQVYKLFGPGNQYVTCAKQLAQQQGLAIDMPAGPSEVCVLADATADPQFVAADLLSQAEHGADSQVLLVTTSKEFAEQVNQELDKQLAELPRMEFAAASLLSSHAVILNDLDEAVDLVNAYAAEHLIIACADADAVAERIVNAGSVFIGNYSPESVGDYASGTNHTLPTNGFARAYSGVSVDSFVKKITYQKLSPKGLQAIGGTVMQMAAAEGLEAHRRAVEVRLGKLAGQTKK